MIKDWAGAFNNTAEKAELKRTIQFCLGESDFGPRFWHAYFRFKGLSYTRIDLAEEVFSNEGYGVHARATLRCLVCRGRRSIAVGGGFGG